MNMVIMRGRLTKDPELRYIQGSGKAVANFSIAVNREFKNAEGKQEADFFNVQSWGKQAESCANYLSKGSDCIVRGRIQNRSYKNQAGETRYTTEIVADKVEFIWGGKKEDKQEMPNAVENGFEALDDDDILF